MSAPSLATEAGLAGNYPEFRFNQRERKLLASVKTYVDNSAPNDVITAQGDLIIGDSGGDAIALAKGSSGLPLVAGASTLSYAQLAAAGIASAAVTLAKLASGITPSHVVKYAGKYTTAGGAASEDQTLSGVLATDIVLVQLQDKGGTPRTIITAKPGTDKITWTFSGDPSTDHVAAYQVLRAAS